MSLTQPMPIDRPAERKRDAIALLDHALGDLEFAGKELEIKDLGSGFFHFADGVVTARTASELVCAYTAARVQVQACLAILDPGHEIRKTITQRPPG
jgi:hypothetical protein